MKITITATAPRGAGKTYILNRLADEVRKIQAELPRREFTLELVEVHPHNDETNQSVSQMLKHFMDDGK